MNLIKQKINWLAIIGQLGLLLHVPAGMATTALIIALIFKEWFALIPFGIVAAFSLILGQFLYRLGKRSKASNLWDAMVIAGLAHMFAYCCYPFLLDLPSSASKWGEVGSSSSVQQSFQCNF